MPTFQVLDERKYPLKVNTMEKDIMPFYRWEHRVTLGWGAREFMLFVDNLMSGLYIEEIIGGHLEQVTDDMLWQALMRYAKENHYLEMQMPITKPEHERAVTYKDLSEVLNDRE